MLLPKPSEKHIREALAELHRINALSLTVPKEDIGQTVPCPAVDELLASNTISNEYKAALEFKRQL